MLVCKECGFEDSKDLVAHIEAEHNLEDYIRKHNPAESELLEEEAVKASPKVSKAEKAEKSESVAARAETKVEIAGISMDALNSAQTHLIPRVNDAYFFPEFTSDVMKDIAEERKVLLTGHTGCGKSSLIEQVAARVRQSRIRVNLNGQTTVGDFVGLWTVRGGETVWVDGALPQAMREGHWLILDEIDFAEPAILAVLNAVLEPKGELMLKEKGHEVVTAHKNFRVFATANTVGCMQDFRGLYQGANIMNEAFLDRWKVYHVDYLPPERESEVLCKTVSRMTMRITPAIIKVVNMVREAHKKEEVQCTFSLRRAIDWAEMIVRHRDPLKAAENTIFSKISRQDAEVIKGIIQRVMAINTEKKK